MKPNLFLILCGLFLTTITKSYAQTFVQNGVTYQVSRGATSEVIVSDYDLSSLDLTIPSNVTDNGITYMVTSIGMNAFRHDKLTSIIIPNSVTSIGSSAFQDNLFTSITIPNSVTSIDQSAFEKNLLTSVTIPNSVTNIGRSAFEFNQLTSVSIPNSITNIRFSTFANNKLTSVTIPNSVDNPENIDLIIPEGLENIYTNNGWIGFKSIANNATLTTTNVELLKNTSIYTLDRCAYA